MPKPAPIPTGLNVYSLDVMIAPAGDDPIPISRGEVNYRDEVTEATRPRPGRPSIVTGMKTTLEVSGVFGTAATSIPMGTYCRVSWVDPDVFNGVEPGGGAERFVVERAWKLPWVGRDVVRFDCHDPGDGSHPIRREPI